VSDNVKIILFLIAMVTISLGSMYMGYKYPEMYMNMPMYHTIGVMSTEINIQYSCGTDPRGFVPFIDKYWCFA
jgi:hypothetical protein